MQYTEFRGCNEYYKIYSDESKEVCQYDFKLPDGNLFSIETNSLNSARQKRDEWFEKKYQGHSNCKIKMVQFFPEEELKMEELKMDGITFIKFTLKEKDITVPMNHHRFDLILDILLKNHGHDFTQFEYVSMHRGVNKEYIILAEDLRQ